MRPAFVRSWSERIYGFLLRLYPAAFRRQAGPDLLEFFRDQIHAVRGRRFGVARLWLRALPDLFTSAFLERWTALRAPVCAPVARLASRPGDSAMNVFLLELRYALRLLRQAPMFTLVAGLVVALGIGAVTTIFSAANGLAFRPLPGAGAPDRLVEIHRTLASPLRAEAPGAGRKRSRTRNALVIGQISLSLLLLVAAGLFLRALDRGQRVDPGFDAAQVATASFDTRTYGYGEERARQFYADLRTRLAGRPGVEAVSYARVLPLSGNRTGDEFRVDGAAAGPGVEGDGAEVMLFAEVDVDYFAALHMPLLSGRGFAATDGPKAAGVVIVNETLARRFFPGGGALGRTIHRGKDPPHHRRGRPRCEGGVSFREC